VIEACNQYAAGQAGQRDKTADTIKDAGIGAIVQPGGSMRDPEVIAACDRLGLAMLFTDRREFRH